MVTVAISSPAADVFGWFHIFEMGFMRKAPSKSDGRQEPPFVFLRFAGMFAFPVALLPAGGQPALPGRPLDLGFGCSQCLEVAVVPVWLPVESPCRADFDGPMPRRHPLWGRAYTFAGRGISVVYLATFKPRQSVAYLL
jgi:hypothetical protein